MRERIAVALMIVGLSGAGYPAMAQSGAWPSVQAQLTQDRIPAGSALEQLVRANQDFRLLRPEEAHDGLPLPLWLRVLWHKAHPKLAGSPLNPNGYPVALRAVYAWMLAHPDLEPGRPEPEPPAEKTAVIGEQRISGAQTTPRSGSDIRINYWNPAKILAASENVGGSGGLGIYRSTDGGASWGQTTLPLAAGDLLHAFPTVEWLSSGMALSTALGISSTGTQLRLRSYRSTDSGATWALEATPSGSQIQVDKQLQWTDHSDASPYKDTSYVIYHNGQPAFVTRRSAAGTWSAPAQVSGSETTGTAVGADIKTDGAGTVFGAWPDTGSRGIYFVKSTDGGATWSGRTRIATTFDSFDIGIPAFNSRRALIYVILGAWRSGSIPHVYAVWTDLSGAAGCTSAAQEPGASVSSTCKSRIWFTRSTDEGTTWETPRKLDDPSTANDQFNPWLVVDETDGILGVTYYGTLADSGRKKTHLYFQSSTDQGASWSTPVQVTTAETDETVAGADMGLQYGDYNGLSGYAGTFVPAWTDRRNGGREEIWSVINSIDSCTAEAVKDQSKGLCWFCWPSTWTFWNAWSTWACTGGPTSTAGCSCWYTGCTRARTGREVHVSLSCSTTIANVSQTMGPQSVCTPLPESGICPQQP